MLDYSNLLGNQVTNKVMTGVDMSRLASNMGCNCEVDRTHVVLKDNSGVRLSEPNVFKQVAKFQQFPGCLG